MSKTVDKLEGELVPSREDFQRWVEEYLFYSNRSDLSDYYPSMGHYLHDQFVRWRHARIYPTRQRQEGNE